MKVEDVLGWLMNYLTRNEFLDNWIVSFLSLLAYRPFFLCVFFCVFMCVCLIDNSVALSSYSSS